MSLQLCFVFKLGLVLEEVIAGDGAHQLAALPVVEDAVHGFARQASHGGEVALPDLLADDDATRPNILAEMFRQFEQGAGDAAFKWQEASGCEHNVRFTQARGEKREQ